mgnify:CR=1 FL=1
MKNFKTAVLLALFAVFFCSQEPESHIVKIGIDHHSSHFFVQAMQRFADGFERETHGRYRVKIYDSGKIGSESQMQEMLSIGSLEITVTGVINTYEPLYCRVWLTDRKIRFRTSGMPVFMRFRIMWP